MGARFSALVQFGFGANPVCCTKGTGYFPRAIRQGRGVDNTIPFTAEVKESVQIYIYSKSEPSWPVPECR